MPVESLTSDVLELLLYPTVPQPCRHLFVPLSECVGVQLLVLLDGRHYAWPRPIRSPSVVDNYLGPHHRAVVPRPALVHIPLPSFIGSFGPSVLVSQDQPSVRGPLPTTTSRAIDWGTSCCVRLHFAHLLGSCTFKLRETYVLVHLNLTLFLVVQIRCFLSSK